MHRVWTSDQYTPQLARRALRNQRSESLSFCGRAVGGGNAIGKKQVANVRCASKLWGQLLSPVGSKSLNLQSNGHVKTPRFGSQKPSGSHEPIL